MDLSFLNIWKIYYLNKQYDKSSPLNFTNSIILTRNLKREKKKRNFLMFLPRRVLMGYEPFQSLRTERKNSCLGNKADQSAAYSLPRASNLFSKCRLEQVANLNDAKSFSSPTYVPSPHQVFLYTKFHSCPSWRES